MPNLLRSNGKMRNKKIILFLVSTQNCVQTYYKDQSISTVGFYKGPTHSSKSWIVRFPGSTWKIFKASIAHAQATVLGDSLLISSSQLVSSNRSGLGRDRRRDRTRQHCVVHFETTFKRRQTLVDRCLTTSRTSSWGEGQHVWANGQARLSDLSNAFPNCSFCESRRKTNVRLFDKIG